MQQKYDSEELARAAAKAAYERIVAEGASGDYPYPKEDVSMRDTDNAVVIEHPDRFRGTVVARYEW